MPLDETGVVAIAGEFRPRHQSMQKAGVRSRTKDFRCRQGIGQPFDRLRTYRRMGDDLGDHRVIERRDVITGSDTRIDTHALRHGQIECQNASC